MNSASTSASETRGKRQNQTRHQQPKPSRTHQLFLLYQSLWYLYEEVRRGGRQKIPRESLHPPRDFLHRCLSSLCLPAPLDQYTKRDQHLEVFGGFGEVWLLVSSLCLVSLALGHIYYIKRREDRRIGCTRYARKVSSSLRKEDKRQRRRLEARI